MRSRWLAAMALGATAAFGIGCGSSTPPPNDQWAAAQADFGRAQAGGAPQVPAAKLHLQLAQEDLQKSKQLMGEDNRRAESLTMLAAAEAKLALSLAQEATAQSQTQQIQGDLQKATAR